MRQQSKVLVLAFTITTAATVTFAQRQWTVTGLEVPELAAIDDMVHNQMTSYGIRGASVAVTKDGRLVFARGYTWDQPGVEAVQPTTLFRTASIGKSLTSIAVHKLIEEGLLSYDTLAAETLGLRAAPGRTPDPWLKHVTIDHLLTHTTGWDSDLPGGIDPLVYQDDFVAASLGVGSPPTRHEIATFMAGWPLQFFPGSRWGYCNVGYMLLGMLAEQATGQDFPEYMFENIFRPVGVQRARLARTLRSDLAPTETTYDGVEGDAYGLNAANAFAAGGMVMAAPDLARVYSALFKPSDSHELLRAETIEAMLSVPFPAGEPIGYGRGWFNEDFFVNSGHTVGWLTDPGDHLDVFGHGGGGGGAHTLAVWRSDGIVFVWLTNKDPVIPTIDFPEIRTWPDHNLWESVGISSRPVGSAPTESWIQAVAHNEGDNGSKWRTDVSLLNRSSQTNAVRLRYHDGERQLDRKLQLTPGAMRTVEDIVGWFGLDGYGPLQVFSSNALDVTSRTYTQSLDGTFGQSMDGVTATSGLESGESVVLMQLREDDVSRTNIGIHNQWRRGARVEIALFDEDGVLLTGHTREIEARQTIQLDRIYYSLAGRTDIGNGYATVTVLSGQDIYVYGSVIDNATGDPTSIPMKSCNGDRHLLIAAAAHTDGASDSVWRTDLCLLNRSTRTAAATVRFHGADGADFSLSAEIAVGHQIRIVDVVAQLGSLGSGALEISSNVPVMASARTYNVGPDGTFGLFLDGVPTSDAVAGGQEFWLPQLRQNQYFRSNIGFFNSGTCRADITINLFDTDGRQIASIRRTLEAESWIQLQEPFALIAGREDIDDGYAQVEVEFGFGVIAYASVIDNRTNDGTAITMKS